MCFCMVQVEMKFEVLPGCVLKKFTIRMQSTLETEHASHADGLLAIAVGWVVFVIECVTGTKCDQVVRTFEKFNLMWNLQNSMKGSNAKIHLHRPSFAKPSFEHSRHLWWWHQRHSTSSNSAGWPHGKWAPEVFVWPASFLCHILAITSSPVLRFAPMFTFDALPPLLPCGTTHSFLFVSHMTRIAWETVCKALGWSQKIHTWWQQKDYAPCRWIDSWSLLVDGRLSSARPLWDCLCAWRMRGLSKIADSYMNKYMLARS